MYLGTWYAAGASESYRTGPTIALADSQRGSPKRTSLPGLSEGSVHRPIRSCPALMTNSRTGSLRRIVICFRESALPLGSHWAQAKPSRSALLADWRHFPGVLPDVLLPASSERGCREGAVLKSPTLSLVEAKGLATPFDSAALPTCEIVESRDQGCRWDVSVTSS